MGPFDCKRQVGSPMRGYDDMPTMNTVNEVTAAAKAMASPKVKAKAKAKVKAKAKAGVLTKQAKR